MWSQIMQEVTSSNLVYQPLLSPILFMLYSNYVLKTCSTIPNKEGIYYQWMTKLLTSKKPSSLTYSVFFKVNLPFKSDSKSMKIKEL